MGFPLRITGEQATIVWAYHTAADVGAWIIEWGYLRAQLRTANPFRLTQSPLYFVAGPKFERQLLDVRVSERELVARVGPRRANAVTDATTRRRTDPVER